MTNTLSVQQQEIVDEMQAYILSLGFVHPDEFAPGVANPKNETREVPAGVFRQDKYIFPIVRKNLSATIVTNTVNDVIVIALTLGDSDNRLTKYYEVNSIHDRQFAKDELLFKVNH
jgi:hypothetical protein